MLSTRGRFKGPANICVMVSFSSDILSFRIPKIPRVDPDDSENVLYEVKQLSEKGTDAEIAGPVPRFPWAKLCSVGLYLQLHNLLQIQTLQLSKRTTKTTYKGTF